MYFFVVVVVFFSTFIFMSCFVILYVLSCVFFFPFVFRFVLFCLVRTSVSLQAGVYPVISVLKPLKGQAQV